MTSKYLPGDKIYLRGITLADANDNYCNWLNDKEVTKGLASGHKPATKEDVEQYIKNVLNDPGKIMFAICSSDNNLHIGNIKIDNFDYIAGTCELGVLIGDKNYWGKGVGTEACNLVLRYAFNTLNLRKVTLSVYGNNPAAIALYEKIGFQKEGNLKNHVFIDGEYHDKIYMSIFKSTFK